MDCKKKKTEKLIRNSTLVVTTKLGNSRVDGGKGESHTVAEPKAGNGPT